MLTMLYSTRSLDYRFGHRSHMLFAVTGRRVCIITWSGLSEGLQFHPEHIICSVDSFSIVSLGKMIQLQMHFGFNQLLQLDSSASNEQHKNIFFLPRFTMPFLPRPNEKGNLPPPDYEHSRDSELFVVKNISFSVTFSSMIN